jgi:hypothetical protein
MIVDPLSLNDPRHGQQNYRDLSKPHQGRRIPHTRALRAMTFL